MPKEARQWSVPDNFEARMLAMSVALIRRAMALRSTSPARGLASPNKRSFGVAAKQDALNFLFVLDFRLRFTYEIYCLDI